MAYNEEKRSIVSLLGDVISEMTQLFQMEIRLVRTEVKESLGRLASSGTSIAAGAIAVLAGLLLVLQSIVAWLVVAGLPPQWGYLIVGGVVLVLGTVFLTNGINHLKATRFLPDRAIDQLKADLATVKEHVT